LFHHNICNPGTKALTEAPTRTYRYPFDTVKVLQQTQDQFKGPLDAFRKTVRAYGFLSLYQGLSSPLAGAMVENAAIFSASPCVRTRA